MFLEMLRLPDMALDIGYDRLVSLITAQRGRHRKVMSMTCLLYRSGCLISSQIYRVVRIVIKAAIRRLIRRHIHFQLIVMLRQKGQTGLWRRLLFVFILQFFILIIVFLAVLFLFIVVVRAAFLLGFIIVVFSGLLG